MDRSPPVKFSSVFDRRFDVVVCGAGWIGFAAARHLAAKNRDVLLIEPSGDLLWESSRALENVSTGTGPFPAWDAWLQAISTPGGSQDGWFDPVRAEIHAAGQLADPGSRIATLLYAQPVHVSHQENRLVTLTVATKSGFRHIQADHWVDTTEHGILARLDQPVLEPAVPAERFQSLVLHTSTPEQIDQAVPALRDAHPGLVCLPFVRPTERRLRWPAGAQPWHRKVPGLVRDLRDRLTETGGGDFLVSHCALREFPVYHFETGQNFGPELSPNLTVLSPSLCGRPLNSPADRFAFGHADADERVGLGASFQRPPLSSPPPPFPNIPSENWDVVVVGTGTAGSLAAMAAARGGARTLAVDLAVCPGGVGTGGGITGYFHGARGGLQTEVDQRVQHLSELLTGKSSPTGRWHHDAKTIALQETFAAEGVVFRGGTLLCEVKKDGNGSVQSLMVATSNGLCRVVAGAFIDATGDGDLCALAGARFRTGREGDHRTLAYSQVALAVVETGESRSLKAYNFDAGWVDPTDPEDLSRARLVGLAQHGSRDKARAPALVMLAPLLGLRQSRQIVTDHTLSLADMIEHRTFSDSVGRVDTLADTHSVDFEFEDDELTFYYWTCRGFRHRLSCDLPYRMLLPRGLANVWIACRAAGMDINASYGLRMQREMQRLGEAAGWAATLAARNGQTSRGIDRVALQSALTQSGSLGDHEAPKTPGETELLAALDQGKPGLHLWRLWKTWETSAQAVSRRLSDENPRTSFYAASVCAMAQDPAGDIRLLQALSDRETGPLPEEHRVPGAHGECVDVPFWVQAIFLLGHAGGTSALPTLRQIAAEPGLPFNVKTILARAVEKLARRLGPDPLLTEIVDLLERNRPSDTLLTPSRSLWRTLNGQPQKPLPNDQGADTRQDHFWQWDLVLSRIRKIVNLPPSTREHSHQTDPRGIVRRAFRTASFPEAESPCI